GYIQTKRLLALEKRPTAIVAISDKTAFGAMSAILEAGLSIPDDLAIISIDNVADSVYTHPPLTTYHIPKSEMGVLAMQKLHRIISGEPEIAVKSVVYGRLIVRESCGKKR
ncbi:MAG: substrate-binding domain-containing protein, partial [Chloroflexota bacterium]|nr:substrate-binding domain-containing protein [Chloroflexota bacterium]